MIPFLCVQLYPRDLFKKKAERRRGNASQPPALKLLLHFFPFLQNKLKCFFSYLELICSCSFCAVWNPPASSLGEIPVKPSGHVALCYLLYGDFCSPDLICEETWCPSSTLRLEHTKSASWSSWFFFLSTYPYSLSSSLTISLLGYSFSLTTLPLASGYTRVIHLHAGLILLLREGPVSFSGLVAPVN